MQSGLVELTVIETLCDVTIQFYSRSQEHTLIDKTTIDLCLKETRNVIHPSEHRFSALYCYMIVSIPIYKI